MYSYVHIKDSGKTRKKRQEMQPKYESDRAATELERIKE